jgi:hypothetical protein
MIGCISIPVGAKVILPGDFTAAANSRAAEVLIDSSAVKAHRPPLEAKGGAQSGDRPLARRTHEQNPCPDKR